MFLHFDLMMVTANKPGQNQDSDVKHVNLHAQKIINRLNHGKSMCSSGQKLEIVVPCTVFYF